MFSSKRLRFYRKLRGKTQKELGIKAGFPDKNADIRIAQYETGSRQPACRIAGRLARALNVSETALSVPEIKSEAEAMQLLFMLEDMLGLRITSMEGKPMLYSASSDEMSSAFSEWEKKYSEYKNSLISKEEYDNWRYTFPEIDKK